MNFNLQLQLFFQMMNVIKVYAIVSLIVMYTAVSLYKI